MISATVLREQHHEQTEAAMARDYQAVTGGIRSDT